MAIRVGRAGNLAAVVAMLLAACGGGTAPTTAGPGASAPAESAAPPSSAPSQTTEQTPSASEACKDPATEIALGSRISAEIVGTSQPPGERRYFCVTIPDGLTSITFELTGLTADLNLIVGHPDLATVQQGGVFFWESSEPGTEAEVVVVKPALTDYVRPGPYYAEVSGQEFGESSPFELIVRGS